MKNKTMINRVQTFLKWLVFAICALIGAKLLFTLVKTLTVGMAIASLAIWGLGIAVVGAGAVYVGFKMLGSKKK